MIIRKAAKPSRCTLCLQDADEAIMRHLRENKPCTHPNCPLRDVITAALDHQRDAPGIIFGTIKKPTTITFGRQQTRSPSMIHILSKRTKCEKFYEFIINQLKKIRKLWVF